MRECCGTNSNVELTARQPFTGSGGARGKARCQRFHLLLIVLRLTSADKGSWPVCPGCRRVPGTTRSQGERCHNAIHSLHLPFHFAGSFLIQFRSLGRQCIMEGACFTFDSDELLTGATKTKIRSATRIAGPGIGAEASVWTS